MKSRGFFGIVAAFVVLAAAQGASPAISSKTFVDPTGDAQTGAPDITSVVVANSGSQISFRVNVANQATLDPSSQILLLIDTDQNSATGALDSLGADYLFEVSATGYDFSHWDGAQWDDSIPYSTVSVSYTNGASISVNASELAGVKAFDFWVRGVRDDGSGQLAVDDAPDNATWTYQLQGTGPTISTMGIAVAGPAKAGKPFAIKVPFVTLLPDGRHVRPDTVACQAKLGGRPFGTGACHWKLPLSARGRRLVVQITVTYRGSQKTLPYSTTVR